MGRGGFEFRGTDRFEIVRRIGRGGMGVVYEAYDRERKIRVALKHLRGFGPDDLLRFKTEFRSLQGIEHPNLVTLGDLVCESDQWFFTMELIVGVDFLGYVRGGASESGAVAGEGGEEAPGACDEARLRSALTQVARGVAELHRMEKVHRDVKPTNVLVTAEGRAVLLDYGLITTAASADQPVTDQTVGTAVYMAPEQAAGKPVGPAADWYSLGIMLYEALTGQVPFGGTALQIFMDKQKHEPPPPGKVVSGVPADLDRLCLELLRFDPAARPREEAILSCLGADVPRGEPSAIYLSRPSTRAEFFVGREREIELLHHAFSTTRQGKAVTVVVQGESGVGKSALITRFARAISARESGVVTLAGRCYARESIPYKAFDGIVDSLARYMSKLSDAEAASLLPQRASLLPRMFPVLGRVEVISQAPELLRPIRDRLELRRRAFGALHELLFRLGESTPLIVVIDDFQWADADSLLLLGDLMRPPEAPPMLLLISTRSTAMLSRETADGRAHEAVIPGELHHVELGPLGEGEARELARRLLEQADLPFAAEAVSIAQEASGHPLFIDELVKYASVADRGSGAAPHLDDAIAARVAQLPEPAALLLELIAVAGAPIGHETLRIAARMDAAELGRQLSLLHAANLIRRGGARGADLSEPYHDRIREAVLARLDDANRNQRHARLAIALETSGGRPELLIRHLEGAGHESRAARYAEEAADRANSALAFERAVAFYQAAIRLGRHGDEELRALRLALSNALLNAGRGAESAQAALDAAEGADRIMRLECKTRAAEQLLICGHIERGLEVLADLLAEVGVRMHTSPRAVLASLLWARLRLRLRGLRWEERHEREVAESDLLRVDVFKAASHGLSMVDNARGADFQARGLLLALRIGEPFRVARELGTESVFEASQGGKGLVRAARLVAETEELAERHGGAYLQAWAATVRGISCYFAGSFREGADLLGKGAAIFGEETTGMTFELNNSRVFRMFALRHLGEFTEMRRLYDRYLLDAARRGDLYVETSLRLYGGLLWLAKDGVEGAWRNLDQAIWQPPEGRFHLQHWYELEARGELALYEGRAAAALVELGDRFEGLERSLLTRIQIVRCLARFLRGRLHLAAAGAGQRTAANRRRAERAARSLGREKIEYATVWSLALRAGLAAQAGDRQTAMRLLGEEVALAEQRDMAFHAAAARWRSGQLLAGDEGARSIAAAESWFRRQSIEEPRQMIEIAAPGFPEPGPG